MHVLLYNYYNTFYSSKTFPCFWATYFERNTPNGKNVAKAAQNSARFLLLIDY